MRSAVDISNYVSAITVNYKTLDLIERCFHSLRQYYPTLPVVLVDNGSGDDSTQFVAEQEGPCTTAILLKGHCGHGLGLHEGLLAARTPYVFTLDSDCGTRRGGFLEEMVRLFFRDEALYAAGEIQWLHHVGRDWRTPDPAYPGQAPYVHPSAMLLDRNKYLGLKPFNRGGHPCEDNMADAFEHDYRVFDFPIGDWVFHLHRGTRNRLREMGL